MTNGAVTTIPGDVAHIAGHGGALYGAAGAHLVRFTADPISGYATTGKLKLADDRLTNVYGISVSYRGAGSVTAVIVYDGTTFGPYTSVASDRVFKTSKNAAAYSRAPQIKINWSSGISEIQNVDIHIAPHPRRSP